MSPFRTSKALLFGHKHHHGFKLQGVITSFLPFLVQLLAVGRVDLKILTNSISLWRLIMDLVLLWLHIISRSVFSSLRLREFNIERSRRGVLLSMDLVIFNKIGRGIAPHLLFESVKLQWLSSFIVQLYDLSSGQPD